MPILKAEVPIHPENLLDEGGLEELDVGRQWWAIYTKPRQEKALARELLAFQVPFFLPLVPKRVVYRGRRIEAQLPLFSSYLFLFGSDDERLRAIATNRVSQLVIVHDADQLVRDLQSVHRLVQSGEDLEVENQLRRGRAVRVKAGPFEGLEGTIETRKSGHRLIVAVQLLQRGVSLEIDDAFIEPL